MAKTAKSSEVEQAVRKYPESPVSRPSDLCRHRDEFTATNYPTRSI